MPLLGLPQSGIHLTNQRHGHLLKYYVGVAAYHIHISLKIKLPVVSTSGIHLYCKFYAYTVHIRNKNIFCMKSFEYTSKVKVHYFIIILHFKCTYILTHL